jgi:hypothetical protein
LEAKVLPAAEAAFLPVRPDEAIVEGYLP